MTRSVLSVVATGARLGALGGALGGFTLPWVGVAIADRSPAALVLVLVLGWVSAPVGAAYGVVTGAVVAAAAFPLRARPHLIRRLRVVWALTAALSVIAISFLLFGWDTSPGPNETMTHVWEEVLSLFALPAAGAAVLAAWLAPKITAPRGYLAGYDTRPADARHNAELAADTDRLPSKAHRRERAQD